MKTTAIFQKSCLMTFRTWVAIITDNLEFGNRYRKTKNQNILSENEFSTYIFLSFLSCSIYIQPSGLKR